MIQYELCFWLKHVCYIKTKDCGSWRGDLCGKWHMLKSKPGNKQINFKALESTQCPGACFRWIVSRGLMVPGWPGPLWKPPPMFRQIAEFGVFEKINFLCFLGPQKTFLSPQNLIWPQKPHFWGGHTSKTFWSGPQFWRYPGLIWPKNSYFEINNFKTIA